LNFAQCNNFLNHGHTKTQRSTKNLSFGQRLLIRYFCRL